jgi:hypothetical protein
MRPERSRTSIAALAVLTISSAGFSQSNSPNTDPLAAPRLAVTRAANDVHLPRVAPHATVDLARPIVRAIVDGSGVSLDNMLVVATWPASDRTEMRARLPPPWGEALPLAYRGLPAFSGYTVPESALRGGANGLFIVELGARARDLAWIEREHAAATNRAGTFAAIVYADADAPVLTVYRATYTLAQSGLTDISLAVRTAEGAVGEVRLHTSSASGGAAPPALVVRAGADGYRVTVGGRWVEPGCRSFGPAPSVTIATTPSGPDTTALGRCLRTLRSNHGIPMDVNSASVAASEIRYGDLVATIMATRESAPGAHDLFAETQLGIAR